jgi:radical SAM protein with 4Fe4S-binding SPASM domain
MMRGDLEKLVAHGAGCGLAMVVGTNGVALTDRRVQSLKAAGAMGAGISVDSLDPAKHDTFRGLPGAWEKTMQGIESCKRHGLPFQIHFSVTEHNAEEVPGMIDFARASGARVLNVFFLVCTGRGESMSDISPVTYERVLNQLVAAQEQSRDLLIRARCAPHYKRIAHQRNPASTLTRAAGYEGGGCLAGIHYCRITPEGGVTACPYIPDEEGNIRDKKFWDIWNQSPTFQSLRNPSLQGKCGSCEFRKLCGGCRARPLAMGDSLMDTDPWCVHVPEGSSSSRWSSNPKNWPGARRRRSACRGFPPSCARWSRTAPKAMCTGWGCTW